MIILPKPLKKLGVFLPLFLIVVVLILVNIAVPKEAEAPVLTVNQNVDVVTTLLKDPISGIYPNSSNDVKSRVINSNLFEGLLNFKNGQLEKGLASTWKNVNPTTWEFTINTNAHFSDGRTLNPNDVKFSIETAVSQNWPVGVPMKQIDAVTVVNDNKLTLKTTIPVPNLLLLIAQIPILSKEQFSKKTDAEFAIGTGPFKLSSFDNQKTQNQVLEQTLVLKRNQDYLGNKSNLGELIYRYLNPTKLAGLNANQLEKGFQIIEPGAISHDLAIQLIDSQYSKTLIPQNQVSVLIFNPSSKALKYTQTNTNPFSQLKVRKAISLAISTNQVIADATEEARPASQLATSLVFGYNPQIHRLGTNQKLASQLLTEAGFADGFTFTLTVPENKLEVAKSIAKQLESLNLDTKVVTIDPNSEPIRVSNAEFAVYLGSWENDFYDTSSLFNSALFSGGAENYIHYSNRKIDDQVSQINNSFDITSREKSLQAGMSLAMDDLIWLPIMERSIPVLVKDTIDLIYSAPFITGVDISGK